jgi:hypothetical protein
MTEIDICNLALARLGDARITALSNSTAQGTYCSLFYAQTVKELQSDYPWQFCRKIATLTATTAPAMGYPAAYTLPADYIRVMRLNNIGEDENFGNYEIFGQTIHTTETGTVRLDYIASVTDTTKFPALFIELLTIKLAGLLAMPLTGSKDLFAQMAELFGATLQKPAFQSLVIDTQAKPTATTAANTVQEICRQAILRVGPMEAFKPYGEPMLLAQSLYEQTRDELLADFEWAFTRSQVSVAKNSTNPITGYAFRYPVPADTKQIIRINNFDQSENNGKWEVIGDFVHTDFTTPIIMDVTTKVTDVSKYPPIFVQLLTITLALKLCSIVEQK